MERFSDLHDQVTPYLVNQCCGLLTGSTVICGVGEDIDVVILEKYRGAVITFAKSLELGLAEGISQQDEQSFRILMPKFGPHYDVIVVPDEKAYFVWVATTLWTRDLYHEPMCKGLQFRDKRISFFQAVREALEALVG